MNDKVLVVDDSDRQIWELVTNVPRLSKTTAILCAFLNFILPGSGTMYAACKGEKSVSKAQCLIAVTQFLLTFFLVGFIWSLYWSYLLVKKSMEERTIDSLMSTPKSSHKQNFYGSKGRG